jgi:hypothetical protein
MHIDAADVVVAELNLAGVQARANLQADPYEFAAQPIARPGPSGERARPDSEPVRWG